MSERREAEAPQVPSDLLQVPATLNTKNVPYVKALLEHAINAQLGRSDDPVCISDIVSAADEGPQLQYVHLVFAAAGMLGITYVGFLWMLETAGIRVLGLGGSSAGAITAGTIATMRERPDERCSLRVLEALNDAERPKFHELWTVSKSDKQLMAKDTLSAWEILKLAWRLDNSRGLAADDKLKEWLQKLQPRPDYTWGELLDKMCLKNHPAEDGNGKVDVQVFDRIDNRSLTDELDAKMRDPEHYPLRLVTAELATQTLVVLPRDAYLFYTDNKPGVQTGGAAAKTAKGLPVRSPNPADFVLGSCSVPIYFKPFEHELPAQICEKPPPHTDWEQELLFGGQTLPKSVVFADGAILSTLPFQLFTSRPKPKLPKIGVTVDTGRERTAPLKIDCLSKYVQALSSTTRLLNDRSYRHQNPVYEDCMVTISAPDFHKLDFDMSQEQREKLLIRGMEAGRRFLDKWRKSKGCWDRFKEMHAKLEEAQALGATGPSAASTAAAMAASTATAVPRSAAGLAVPKEAAAAADYGPLTPERYAVQ